MSGNISVDESSTMRMTLRDRFVRILATNEYCRLGFFSPFVQDLQPSSDGPPCLDVFCTGVSQGIDGGWMGYKAGNRFRARARKLLVSGHTQQH
jgi:hypothetical protein